jgi:hypothetical protein
MGYIRHHAIVVTSYASFGSSLEDAHEKAKEIFNTMNHYNDSRNNVVSEIVVSPVNGYASFFIAPDGSKEGWEESQDGDTKRELFIRWINEQAYEDGSNSISYAELFYGDDEGHSEIVNHN